MSGLENGSRGSCDSVSQLTSNKCIYGMGHDGFHVWRPAPDLSGWIDFNGTLVRADAIIGIFDDGLGWESPDDGTPCAQVILSGSDRKFFYKGTRDELVKAIKDSVGL